ncbi:hypothetical protein LSP03_05430 [Lysinibacillus sphaericus]|nr:hypothetical protein LSP03_05430 [Lysinibacillus sphaericus]
MSTANIKNTIRNMLVVTSISLLMIRKPVVNPIIMPKNIIKKFAFIINSPSFSVYNKKDYQIN